MNWIKKINKYKDLNLRLEVADDLIRNTFFPGVLTQKLVDLTKKRHQNQNGGQNRKTTNPVMKVKSNKSKIKCEKKSKSKTL